jgi:hypothetical protein
VSVSMWGIWLMVGNRTEWKVDSGQWTEPMGPGVPRRSFAPLERSDPP